MEQINIRQTPIYNFLRNINPPEFVSPTFVLFFPAKSPSVEEIGNGREKATRSEKVQESREPQAGAAEKPARMTTALIVLSRRPVQSTRREFAIISSSSPKARATGFRSVGAGAWASARQVSETVCFAFMLKLRLPILGLAAINYLLIILRFLTATGSR